MSDNAKTAQKPNVQMNTVQKNKKDPVYTVKEFASSPESVGADADIVKAALLLGGKKEYTISEAKEIVKNFKEKEVR